MPDNLIPSRNISQWIACMLAAVAITGCNKTQQTEKPVAPPDTSGTALFNGTSLDGWLGDTTYWRVENGNMVGEITPETLLQRNSFIIWQGDMPADFELVLEFNITENGNSGVNYRSAALDDIPYALKGYQCDIDGKNNYTGQNYEERGRTTLAYRGEVVTVNQPEEQDAATSLKAQVENNAWTVREVTASLGDADVLLDKINKGDWNTCRIVAKGNRLQHFINDVLMSDVTDMDTLNGKQDGQLGVQVHVGPPMKVMYRGFRLKDLTK